MYLWRKALLKRLKGFFLSKSPVEKLTLVPLPKDPTTKSVTMDVQATPGNSGDKGAAKPQSPEDAYQLLATNIQKYLPQAPLTLVRKAYEFAADRHGPQIRHSGDPYIMHPLAVATILTDLRVDLDSIVAAILHDVVEDTDTPLEEIEKEFGKEVAELVDGLTKIGKIQFRSSQERLAENFRKMIMAMAKDLRVILVKLADRLHNMRTLSFCPSDKRDRVAQETLEIYAPLAHRLGIYGIKSELEDLCLRQLKRDFYQEIRGKVSAKKAERQAYIEEVKAVVEKELKRYGLNTALVYGRPKHFFSIYKKMLDRQLSFEDIHDLFAFRIIVESVKDCYEALGIVHAMWKPMPGRFKDYIAMPKANLYQSLHTTVIRPNGEPAEFQIRTREMHEICEFGVAAHWAYKEKKGAGDNGTDLKKFSWMRQMMAWQSEIKDPDEFLEAVKVDLFDEEIYVFTPRGDVVELSAKATALDFAFAVHTDVGLRTIGAKINGRMVPIKATLKSGDIIEIVTSPNQHPNKDWLNFVVTSKARNKIRSFLRTEQRDRSRKIGLEILTQELSERDVSVDKILKSSSLTDHLVGLSKEASFDEMLIALGYGRINGKDLAAKAYPDKKNQAAVPESHAPERSQPTIGARPTKQGIVVSGIENVLVNFGRCCNPLPGENVVGFITRGRGVTIHRGDCSKALDIDPSRRVDVQWTASEQEQTLHTASIRVMARDQMGVLADITTTIASCGGNIQKASVRTSPDMRGIVDIELGIKSLTQLQAIIRKLESLSAVVTVERRGSGKL